MTITPDQLRTWSEQLCTLPAVDFFSALSALGITGEIVSKTEDYVVVEPPPDGASRIGLVRENLGRNRGYLGSFEIAFDRVRVTRAQLEQRFGSGSLSPRVDYDRPFAVNYRVEIPGAPYRCTISASFAEEPTAGTPAVEITMRRDIVRSREPSGAPPPGRA